MLRPFLTACVLFLCLLPGVGRAEYKIASGDTIQIEVVEDATLNRTLLVLPDGSVDFPGAGSLRVAGLSTSTVQAALSAALASQFNIRPTIYVSVVGVSEPQAEAVAASAPEVNVYVMGEINKPGVIEDADDLTLLQAIAQAGGFTRFAATKRIELHRIDPATQTEQVLLFNFRNGGGISGATELRDGDVIVVPERRLFE